MKLRRVTIVSFKSFLWLLLSFLLVNMLVKSYFISKQQQKDKELREFALNKDKERFKQLIQRDKYENVNCESIFELNRQEIDKAKDILNKLRNETKIKKGSQDIPLLPDTNFVFGKSRCALFRDLRGYDKYQVSQFEREFPLAFTILTNENVEQFERFLRLIYRSHNVYCVHVDAKSSPEFIRAIRSIVQCFSNVFIASKLERVVYASFSRFQADLNCINDLLHLNEDTYLNENFGLTNQEEILQKKKLSNWKYLLNTASSEFPLRTNSELVKILHMYKSTNEIEVIKYISPRRIKIKYEIIQNEKGHDIFVRTNESNPQPPHGFKINKGYAYGAFSRQFIEYVMSNQKARDLIEWSRNTFSPDEFIWATLHTNLQFNPPGAYKPTNEKRINTVARFSGWSGEYDCKGKWRHSICLFSIEDLSKIYKLPHFILNKFSLSFEPIAYQCMEEIYFNRTMQQKKPDLNYYCEFHRNHFTQSLCADI